MTVCTGTDISTCNDHGICADDGTGSNAICTCDDGWTGAQCDTGWL